MSCWCCKYVRWFESMTPPGPPKHWWVSSWWAPTAMWTCSEARPLLRLSTRALEAVRIITWTCSIKRPGQKNRNGTYYTSTAIRVSAAAPPNLLLAWQEYRPKSPGLTIRVCLKEGTQVNAMRIYENCEVCSWCKVNLCPLFLLPLVVTTPSLLHSTLGFGQPVQKGGLLLQCLRWFQCWASIFLFLVLKLTCHHAHNLHSTICLGNDLRHNVNNIRSEMHLNCHMNSITHTALG